MEALQASGGRRAGGGTRPACGRQARVPPCPLQGSVPQEARDLRCAPTARGDFFGGVSREGLGISVPISSGLRETPLYKSLLFRTGVPPFPNRGRSGLATCATAYGSEVALRAAFFSARLPRLRSGQVPPCPPGKNEEASRKKRGISPTKSFGAGRCAPTARGVLYGGAEGPTHKTCATGEPEVGFPRAPSKDPLHGSSYCRG